MAVCQGSRDASVRSLRPMIARLRLVRRPAVIGINCCRLGIGSAGAAAMVKFMAVIRLLRWVRPVRIAAVAIRVVAIWVITIPVVATRKQKRNQQQ